MGTGSLSLTRNMSGTAAVIGSVVGALLIAATLLVVFNDNRQYSTNQADATELAAKPSFVTSQTKFYYGTLYSDSSCTKPVTVDVSAFTHGAINPTAETGPSGTTKWVMARPVPTSNPKVSQCSIDYTLAT